MTYFKLVLVLHKSFKVRTFAYSLQFAIFAELASVNSQTVF